MTESNVDQHKMTESNVDQHKMTESNVDQQSYIVGDLSSHITGSRLPTNRQVLEVLFHKMRHCHLSLDQSLQLVTKEVLTFWERVSIPTQDIRRCTKKLADLYDEYRIVQKSQNKKSQSSVKREEDLVERLKRLFDILHGNAMNVMDESRRVFLIDQRSVEPTMCMADLNQNVETAQLLLGERSIDQEIVPEHLEVHSQDMEQEIILVESEIAGKHFGIKTTTQGTQTCDMTSSSILGQHFVIETTTQGTQTCDMIPVVASPGNMRVLRSSNVNDYSTEQLVENFSQLSSQGSLSNIESSTSQSSQSTISSPLSIGAVFCTTGRNYKKKNIRGTKNIMTPNLALTLDYCNISFAKSVLLIAALAEAFNCPIDDVILNKKSFKEMRQSVRQKKTENIKELFHESDIKFLIVMWDGKIIPDSVQCKQYDRLPVTVTNHEVEQLLGIPGLEDGKGVTQGSAVYELLYDWGLIGYVKALCCDTTASNLGVKAGAAVNLERMLETDLLYLPCRHHISEIVLAKVFQLKFPVSTGPDILLFKKFKNSWNGIDQKKFKVASEDRPINPQLMLQRQEIINYIEQCIKQNQPSDDYEELLRLCLTFLGVGEAKFRKPGACHRARWMAQAIYCLKIYLFRDSFPLDADEEQNLFDVCQFIVFVYIKIWFSAPLAPEAPNNDLNLIKNLYFYENVDPNISRGALGKIRNHLWYLSPETCALAFFDQTLSAETKKKMVEGLSFDSGSTTSAPKRLCLRNEADFASLASKNIEYFINSSSMNFFDRFDLDTSFLQTDCESWPTNDKFLENQQIVRHLRVVNDTSERAVKLAQECMNRTTTNEDQKQYLAQIVKEYRKEFPNEKKELLLKKRRTE